MRHEIAAQSRLVCLVVALVLFGCDQKDAPTQVVAKPKAHVSESIAALHPDPSITTAEIRARLSEPREDHLFNTISMLVTKRHDKEIVALLEHVWSGKKSGYPDLAWTALERPIVRVALAQTLAQADPSNAEYRAYLLQAIESDDKLVHTHAILALGMLGDETLISSLEKLVHSPDRSRSSAAITSLASMRRSSANGVLEQLRKTYADDPWRSNAIGEALEMFKG